MLECVRGGECVWGREKKKKREKESNDTSIVMISNIAIIMK
jgi:hypothetical protein